MKYKKIGGYIALLIGVILLCYGIYGSYRMYEARRDIEQKTQYIPGESVRGFIKEEFEGKVDEYIVPVTLCYIGAAIFLIGGWVLVRGSRPKGT